MSDQLERVARAIDPMAFEEWTTPPRGLEMAKPEFVHLEHLRRQSRANTRARAVLEALRPEIEDAERWQVHMRFMDDGRGAAARHQEWIDAARQEGNDAN